MSAYGRIFSSLFGLGRLCPWLVGFLMIGSPSEFTSAQTDCARTVQKGQEFLLRSQLPSGWFSASNEPVSTALAVPALVRSGISPCHPDVARSVAKLREWLYDEVSHGGGAHPELETSLVVLCLADRDPRGTSKALFDAAKQFLRRYQWTRDDGIAEDHPYFGGFGRGPMNRPNVSATVLFVDAILALGPDEQPDKGRLEMAARFLTRSQRADGGFGAFPAISAIVVDDRLNRCYGHVTTDGLRGVLALKDSGPVCSALAWLGHNYDLTQNPGLDEGGIFYYYQSLANALHVAGVKYLSSEGRQFDWRSDLARVLAGKQNADGSWHNRDGRWHEDDPVLATAHALRAMSYCDIALPPELSQR